jgi:hypothetical protein
MVSPRPGGCHGPCSARVNTARRHHDQAADALATAARATITRRLAIHDWPAALEKRPEDIKIVVDMTAAE